MSKKPSPDSSGKRVSLHQAGGNSRGRNVRETIESIAIAFILAFLFRTFEAEAFVIPTGSMAPTLQGRHKDADCPKCGHRVRANASLEEEGFWQNGHDPGRDVVAMRCPICRYLMPVDYELLPGGKRREPYPAYTGDRILVGKFAYEFGDPQRWDVVVFKFPGDAKMNYIKRLIGLPNEAVRIKHGDIFVRPNQSDVPFEIARKPPEKILAMMQIVDDSRYNSRDLMEKGWPVPWQPWHFGAPNAWTSELTQSSAAEPSLMQTFSIDANDKDKSIHWLRYEHIPPSPGDWRELEAGPLPPDYPIPPRLITDFYAYNTSVHRSDNPEFDDRADRMGLHWVGDLIVEADVEVRQARGELLLELVEAGRRFTCRIDLTSGEAVLSAEGVENFAPKAQTRLHQPGTYSLRFANVDDQLVLWVNDRVVAFDNTTDYVLPADSNASPREADLAPVGIGARGADLTVSQLRVLRDIYYIADKATIGGERPITDFVRSPVEMLTPERLLAFLSSPDRWDEFADRRSVDFPLEKDQFFMLGDNSPFSKDSRLWGHTEHDYYVDRDLLIGKALFIYWPHSWNTPLPMFPNFKDMGFVR